jgi:peptidoglycan-N-acetylglucosamine deacetylase
MPPQPPDFPASARGPRHAAGAAPPAAGVAGLEEADSTGRHRRPESLADHTRRRSISALPDPAASRSAQRRAEAMWHVAERDRAAGQPSRSSRHGGGRRPAAPGATPRNKPGRGKHAKPGVPLSLTVRPIPVVRDAAGAVRDWALDTGGQPPATGSHRAPGTLPIESWLLVGKHRQQALLAALVAAGLALVMIPIQQNTGVNPVNAADHAAISAPAGRKSPAKKDPPDRTEPAKQRDTPVKNKPAPSAPPSPAGEKPAEEPAIVVPGGDGPAKSLRTTGSAAIALTFDDGPDPVQTPKILALLAKYDIKATFCLIGQNVQKHPEIVRQIVAAGHTLCNHTWDHSLTIGTDNPAAIRADLERTSAAIRAAAPGAEIPFFRAPGGNFTDRLVSVAYGEQMTSLYWEVDPRDWDHTTDADDGTHTERVIADVRTYVKPGAIILSHDFNQPDTVTAYETLLPYLTENFRIGLPEAPSPAEPPAPEPERARSDPPAAESADPPPAAADS